MMAAYWKRCDKAEENAWDDTFGEGFTFYCECHGFSPKGLVPVEGVLIEDGDHDLEGDVSDAILLGFEEGGAPWTRRAAARVLALLRSRAIGGEKTP
jgi:hypothetical protein